jgi:hypothetical protein
MQSVDFLKKLCLKFQYKSNINKTHLFQVTIKLQNDDLCLSQELQGKPL